MRKQTRLKLVTTSLLLTGTIAAPAILHTPATVVYAAESEAEALMARISNLPPIEDLNETHAEEVKGLMNTYAELKMADRIAVNNYEVLKESFDSLVKKGILTNEDNSILQEQELQRKKQADRDISDVAVTQAKEYTFHSDGKAGKTIIIRYTTDADGDGEGDRPTRIVLTGPDGTTYPVSNTSLSMSDGEKLKVDLTWTDLYLQLDFSNASQGNWTLETSQAVTFSAKEFAGVASDIDSEDDTKPATEEAPKKRKNPIVPLLILGTIIAGAVFAIRKFISVMRAPDAPTVDETQLKENEPRRLSDEEQLALMKEEYRRQQEDTGHLDNSGYNQPQRDLNFEPEYIPTRRGPLRYDDDDPEEAVQKPAPTPVSFEMEEEEDTGILRKEDKPDHFNPPVDETADVLGGFDV